ncbi:MAG TPA: Cro/Cl family transcriptional regulator [Lactobacillus sp.]|nr:Cro/Cl family transcriptional regulator [Lactobacillus sp.]
MTPMKEDYLKMIFELGGVSGKVSNKQLSLSLDIAAASVTEMINKLVEERLVSHTPYAGISLTKSGRKAAEELVRKHRLWECFLFEKLGYTLATVHQEAEKLEHALTPEMAKRLSAMLGEPRYCPHGGVIPDANGHYLQQSRVTLGTLDVGQSGHIERVIDEVSLIDYTVKIDLRLDDEFTVTAKTLDAVIIKLARTGKELAVDADRADHIFVEL